jgi:pimeloyl-ACP methyl ester carboxylesterase
MTGDAAKRWCGQCRLHVRDVSQMTRAEVAELLRAPEGRGCLRIWRRPDGRVIWKRDPAIANGFVPTELWRFVRQIKPPIIYVLGGRSTVVPAATQEELKKALPQAEIVTVPGTGH